MAKAPKTPKKPRPAPVIRINGVAGVDEAGRGPLAGPVSVAAVILDPANIPAGLDDSKKLTARRREALFGEIMDKALAVSVIFSPPEEIDRLNVRGATLKAMRDCVAGLAVAPDEAAIDGRDVPKDMPCPAQAIIGGDGLHPSIAAASIIAKVMRDRFMTALDGSCPGYGFARHMGYGTPDHLAAIARLGPCPHHRFSFAPMRLIDQAL